MVNLPGHTDYPINPVDWVIPKAYALNRWPVATLWFEHYTAGEYSQKIYCSATEEVLT